MDVDRLVEEVEKAIFRDWKTSPTKDIARSAILATLRGVRDCPPPLPFGDNDAHALNYSAQIDHLIKTVEG